MKDGVFLVEVDYMIINDNEDCFVFMFVIELGLLNDFELYVLFLLMSLKCSEDRV